MYPFNAAHFIGKSIHHLTVTITQTSLPNFAVLRVCMIFEVDVINLIYVCTHTYTLTMKASPSTH